MLAMSVDGCHFQALNQNYGILFGLTVFFSLTDTIFRLPLSLSHFYSGALSSCFKFPTDVNQEGAAYKAITMAMRAIESAVNGHAGVDRSRDASELLRQPVSLLITGL